MIFTLLLSSSLLIVIMLMVIVISVRFSIILRKREIEAEKKRSLLQNQIDEIRELFINDITKILAEIKKLLK